MVSNEVHPFWFCNDLAAYKRLQTREVNIGEIAMGGNNPIRIQSMTTTDTMDTIATVEQTIRIYEAGGEYVRITAPSKKEAHNLAEIKKELKRRGYNIPLIADIHFTPNAAEIAARIVEKVRVNPGNYADKKKFQLIEYTNAQYAEELERIRDKFTPLVKICKQEGTVMRIGTNHGSLSDRIMSRYGDTPLGMVESALEFLRICESENFHEIVLSMKASNTQVMVQAYRLLVNKMAEEGMNYPLHLGVTEAGDGEDGRIKSAVGIGALLEDGLGDTVRVSLTEAPEAEVPVCHDLIKRYDNRSEHKPIKSVHYFPKNPFAYQKRTSKIVDNIGGKNVPVIVADFSKEKITTHKQLQDIGYHYSESLDKWNIAEQAADYLFLENQTLDFDIPGTLKVIVSSNFWQKNKETNYSSYPLFEFEDYWKTQEKSDKLNFIRTKLSDLTTFDFKVADFDNSIVLVLETDNVHAMPELRRAIFLLEENKIDCPVIISLKYNNLSQDERMLYPATDAGALLIDGYGDGLLINANKETRKQTNTIAFGILQASRTRISKTEYISCPSCGRTLFDLEETTAKIRARTNHLKGVKIGIMGCIVNGPGEMADADYGYVGSGVGKITLYKGQEVVKRAIDSEKAVDALIDLIRENGDWVELEK